jgi:hypothetical protein
LPSPRPFRGELDLRRLNWRHAEAERARLQAPSRLTFERVSESPQRLRLLLTPLVLTGPAVRLAVSGQADWPAQANLELAAEGLPLTDFRTFLPELPEWLGVDSASASAPLDQGQVTGRVRSVLVATPGSGAALRFESQFDLAEAGLSLTGQVFRATSGRVANVEAQLPVRVRWGTGEPMATWEAESPLRLHTEATPNPELWGWLMSRYGIEAREPALSAEVSGTAHRLRGQVRFQAETIRSENRIGPWPIPDLERLEATLRLEESGRARLETQADVASHRLSGWCEVPMGAPDVASLGSWRAPDWRQATAKLSLTSVSRERWATLAPNLLLPSGEVNVEWELKPGLEMAGRFRLADLATQPLPGVGAIRQLKVEGSVNREGVRFEQGTAEWSGRPISFGGWYGFGTNPAPRLQVSLAGTNLALVRTGDVFLRGDAQLELTGSSLADVRGAGDVKLHDSLFLRELQSLVEGSVQQPTSRPVELCRAGDLRAGAHGVRVRQRLVAERADLRSPRTHRRPRFAQGVSRGRTTTRRALCL